MFKMRIRYMAFVVCVMMLTAFLSACSGNNSNGNEPTAMTQDELEGVFMGYTQWSLYNPAETVVSNELAVKFKNNIKLPTIQDDINVQKVEFGEIVPLKNGNAASLSVYTHYSSNTVMRFILTIGDVEYRQSENLEASYVDPNYAYALILGSDAETPTDVLLVVNTGSVTKITSLIHKYALTIGNILEIRENGVMVISQRVNVLGTRYAHAEFVYDPQEYSNSFMKLPGMWVFDEEEYTNVTLTGDMDVTVIDDNGREKPFKLPEGTRFTLTETDLEKVYFKTEAGTHGYFEYSIGARTINCVDESLVLGYQANADAAVEEFKYRT